MPTYLEDETLSNRIRNISDLKNFDKDNIPESVIEKIQPLIDDEGFEPTKIRGASVACEAMCMWTRAMHTYYFVAKEVEPKKAALANARAELEETNKLLAAAEAKLKAVNDKIAALEATLKAAEEKMAQFSNKSKQDGPAKPLKAG